MTIREYFLHLPKVELHVHAEGAVSAETYYQLAEENGVKLPADDLDSWKSFFEFSDFQHFIKVYIAAVSAIRKASDYEFIVEAFYGNQKSQNIIYSEAYLSASFLAGRFADEDILDALQSGMQSGEEKYGVRVNFIPDIARNLPESREKVLDFILKGQQRGMFIGLGLGGMENGFPAGMFKETYLRAKAAGLRLVAHAGEAAGPESIWDALHSLGAERIGHGIRCLDDADLVTYLRDNMIHIEVSPVSNYCLKLVGADSVHPIRKMVDSGLFCSIHSDDPAMFSTDLTSQYCLLHAQGFGVEALLQLNMNAVEASFLTEPEKAVLREKILQYVSVTPKPG